MNPLLLPDLGLVDLLFHLQDRNALLSELLRRRRISGDIMRSCKGDPHCYHADEEGKLLFNTIITSQSYTENTSATDLPGTLIIVIKLVDSLSPSKVHHRLSLVTIGSP